MMQDRRHHMVVRTTPSGLLAVAMISPTVSAVDRRVSANLVFWDQDRGFDTIVTNADVLSEVSPFWYHAGASGEVLPYVTPVGATYEDPAAWLALRSRFKGGAARRNSSVAEITAYR